MNNFQTTCSPEKRVFSNWIKSKLILSISLQLFIAADLYSQNGEFNVPPPSEQTWERIEDMSHPPSLRARPTDIDEDDDAQKLVPVNDVDFVALGVISLLLLGCKVYKSKKRTV